MCTCQVLIFGAPPLPFPSAGGGDKYCSRTWFDLETLACYMIVCYFL